jgi:exodeoxyribonuclease VIII
MILKETSEQYDLRRRSEWISPSDIKGLRVPMDFIVNRQKPATPKDYFDIGTAFHTAILEPDVFGKSVTYIPEEDFPDQEKKNMDGSCKLSPVNKEKLAEVHAQNKGRIVLREADWNMIAEMVLSFQGHWGASRMVNLKKGMAEYSFYTRYVFLRNGDLDRIEGCPADAKRDSKLTLLVRTKADYVHEKDRPYAMDLKSAASVDPREFGRMAANLEYDIQGAMVCDMVSANVGEYYESFIFVAIEKVPPYYVAMYDLNYTDYKDAHNKYIKRLNVIRKAKNDGKFAGFEYLADNEWGLLPLEFPAWYKKYQNESKF